MCYNDECLIEIESCIDGQTSTVSTSGRVEGTAIAVRFFYFLGGDKCSLTVKNNEAVQIRRGEQNIEMRFRSGESSECLIRCGELCGTFSVFTRSLTFTQGDKDILSIVYILDGQEIQLKFTAERK